MVGLSRGSAPAWVRSWFPPSPSDSPKSPGTVGWVARQWTQLTLSQQIRAVRTYRVSVIALVLLGGVGAAAFSFSVTPLYRASAQLMFSPNFPTSDISELNNGGNYILQRVRSYNEAINSPEIATLVVNRLGLPYSPAEVMSKVSVSTKASTAVVTVEVTDPSPERARDIANAIAEEVPAFIDRLETPTQIQTSPVKTAVIRPATTPASPFSPDRVTHVGLGLLGGLGIGVITALFRFSRDRTVRNDEHAAEVAELALVGAVSTDPKPVPLPRDGDAVARSEPYRQIRTNLRLRSAGQRWTSITVTGSMPGEGNSAMAANLAIALAQAGETVVLIDADLRNPAVHQLFDIPNAVGLSSLLRSEMPVNQALRQWRLDLPLYLLPAGPTSNAPTEPLFQPNELARVMESLRVSGIFAVIDAPPLLADSEGMQLISITDATVVSTRIGFTGADRLAATVAVLRTVRANLLGLVAIHGPR